MKNESNQELSILFWLWKAKKNNDGLVPIYVRITLNGLRDRFSSGKKINASADRIRITTLLAHIRATDFLRRTRRFGLHTSLTQILAARPTDCGFADRFMTFGQKYEPLTDILNIWAV
jgi:hypothetical protein